MKPADVFQLSAAYQAVGVLSTAFEHELLHPLIGGHKRSAAEIAKLRDLPDVHVEQLMNCLVALDVVEVQDGSYSLTEGWNTSYQEPGTRAALCDLAESVRRWFSWVPLHVNRAIKESQEEEMFRTGQGLEAYLLGVRDFNEAISDKVVEVLGPYVREARCSSFADVGGGHAGFSLKLLARHPNLRGDVLDLPSTLSISRSMNNGNPLSDRLRFVEADARDLSLAKEQYDLVLVNDLLHSFEQGSKQRIVDNVLKIVRRGGLLAFTKFTHLTRSPGRENAFFSMKLFANTNGTGFLESDEVTVGMLEGHGARLLESFTCGNKSGFIFQAPT